MRAMRGLCEEAARAPLEALGKWPCKSPHLSNVDAARGSVIPERRPAPVAARELGVQRVRTLAEHAVCERSSRRLVR